MGTQKNRLNETVLLSTQNIYYNLWVRNYLQFYAEKVVYLHLWICKTNCDHKNLGSDEAISGTKFDKHYAHRSMYTYDNSLNILGK